MSIETLERPNIASMSFVEVVATRPGEAAAHQCAEVWAENAYERINSQLDELAVLYERRLIRQYHGSMITIESFATRDAACTELEEVFTIVTEHSAHSKSGVEKSYAVTMLPNDSEKGGYRIICRGGEVIVREPDADGEEVDVQNPARKQALIEDFMFRSIIANMEETDRVGEARIAADYDAYLKHLDYSHYGEYFRDRNEVQAWLLKYELKRKEQKDNLTSHVVAQDIDFVAS